MKGAEKMKNKKAKKAGNKKNFALPILPIALVAGGVLLHNRNKKKKAQQQEHE